MLKDENPLSMKLCIKKLKDQIALKAHTSNCNFFLSLNTFMNNINVNYFYNHQEGYGPSYLVGLSQNNISNSGRNLDPFEIQLQIRLAKFVLSLSRNKCDDLCTILSLAFKQINFSDRNQQWSCKIPTMPNDIHILYKTNQHTILNNLSYPRVLNINSHSYIELVELIQNALVNNMNYLDIFSNYKNDNNTRIVLFSYNITSPQTKTP